MNAMANAARNELLRDGTSHVSVERRHTKKAILALPMS
jgi:hypothetical protein